MLVNAGCALKILGSMQCRGIKMSPSATAHACRTHPQPEMFKIAMDRMAAKGETPDGETLMSMESVRQLQDDLNLTYSIAIKVWNRLQHVRKLDLFNAGRFGGLVMHVMMHAQ